MKENIETSELNNNVGRNPHDSINNFIVLSQKNEISKEQEYEMSKWKSSSKLKGAIWYFLSGLYLLIAGIIFQVKYDEITEIRQDYYQTCKANEACTFPINVHEKIEGPVYLFVEMKNYNQNTFIYFEKYNPSQIYDNISDGKSSSCEPFRTNEKVMSKPYLNLDKKEISGLDTAFPCGLRAKDHFTDKFTIKNEKTGKVYSEDNNGISKKDISWKYDREHIKNKDRSKQWVDLEDERFQVWMRPSGLSKFRKTIGRIDESLEAGTYQITTDNTYNHLDFDTTKTLIISNVNSMGGKGLLLVVAHLAGGAIGIFGAVGLAIWNFRKRLPQ